MITTNGTVNKLKNGEIRVPDPIQREKTTLAPSSSKLPPAKRPKMMVNGSSGSKDNGTVIRLNGGMKLPNGMLSTNSVKEILKRYSSGRQCSCHSRIEELERTVEMWKIKAAQLQLSLAQYGTNNFKTPSSIPETRPASNTSMSSSSPFASPASVVKTIVDVRSKLLTNAFIFPSTSGNVDNASKPQDLNKSTTIVVNGTHEQTKKGLVDRRSVGSLQPVYSQPTPSAANAVVAKSLPDSKAGVVLQNRIEDLTVVDLTDEAEESVESQTPSSSVGTKGCLSINGNAKAPPLPLPLPKLISCKRPVESSVPQTVSISSSPITTAPASPATIRIQQSTREVRPSLPPPPLFHSGQNDSRRSGLPSAAAAVIVPSSRPLSLPPAPVLFVKLEGTGVVVSWNLTDSASEVSIKSYQLFSREQITREWQLVGNIPPLPLPMAVTLHQFQRGCQYSFRVRAIGFNGGVSQFSNESDVRL